MYVWPCVIYENDEKNQLDATTLFYYHKYLSMFWASICPSSWVQIVYYCIWCSALGVVAEVLGSRCVVLCTVCKFVSDSDTNLHTVHKTTHRLLRTTTTTPYAVVYNLYTPEDGHIDCPKHVELFMIINQIIGSSWYLLSSSYSSDAEEQSLTEGTAALLGEWFVTFQTTAMPSSSQSSGTRRILRGLQNLKTKAVRSFEKISNRLPVDTAS